jgi:hypothetical protein
MHAFTDRTRVSTRWLLQLIGERGLSVIGLLRVTHAQGTKAHYIAILSDGRHVCDCCMLLNLGIPCRHFFKAFSMQINGLHFSIGLIQARYVFSQSKCEG